MRSFPGEPIVLTGCGWVTPAAAGTIAQVLEAVCHTRSAPSPDRRYHPVPDDLRNHYPGLSAELQRDKGSWMTAAALDHACRQAALLPGTLDPERVGMVLGCGLAGQLGMIGFANEVRQQSARFVSPIHFPQTVGNYIAGALARGCTIRGPNLTLASGAASGLDAIIEACALLAAHSADVIFAGGTETLSDELAQGLAEPGVLLSEGACLFVLERSGQAAARGAGTLAMVTGAAYQPAGVHKIPAPGEAIVSVASGRLPGAIFIEHWTGRCLGASGAAAVAAAIAAAEGRNLPLIDAHDPASISIRPVADDHLPAVDGALPAMVLADADGRHRTILEMAVPRNPRL